MALIHCNFYSETLGVASSMDVIVPQASFNQVKTNSRQIAGGLPVLYLLHGMSDDHTIWQRRTSIERYVTPLDIIVVMPAVNRSFYTDMAYGPKYWTFISKELPFIVKDFFHVSDQREDTYVAGLSMGGYGAFKLALSYPERYAAAASLSGAVDIAELAREMHKEYTKTNNENVISDAKLIFGEYLSVEGSKNDLFYLAENVAKSNGPKPRLYQCCGTEDFLYKHNIKFRDFCRKLSLDLVYEEESATHEWGYWDMKIQSVLKFMFG
ncbi:MAG: esterase family protein [Clostridiaceae bacterium]|nr:esterase family protein [Clostridiaceae bacterium]